MPKTVTSLSARRAWIEIEAGKSQSSGTGSLSARRAWIEIYDTQIYTPISIWSLSARRAWIEMDWASVITAMTSVALRKESVDRNDFPIVPVELTTRRSPQGERG